MAKVLLDWKAPSEKVMKEYVKTLDDKCKKEFAEVCVEFTEEGKINIKKTEAKKWLYKNCNEDIEWKNAPKNARPMSSAEEIASWLKLEV